MVKELSVSVRGTSPLLMNSPQGVNPTHPLVKEMKSISKLRNRTDDQEERIMEIKWELGLYYDKEIGVYLPSDYFQACLREAAKTGRKGRDVVKGIWVNPAFIPLIYEGPRLVKDLMEDMRFRDVRPGKLKKTTSILLCRPRFNVWSAKFSIVYDEAVWQKEDILKFLEIGGRFCGVGDYRPRYGTFEVFEHD